MSDQPDPHALPAELRPVEDALRSDGAQWRQHSPAPDRLLAFYTGLAEHRALNSTPTHTAAPSRPVHIAERGSSMKRSSLLGGAGAVALAAALIVAFVTIFHSHAGPGATSSTITPPTVLHVSPSQGWVKPAALAFGKGIAFAHSDPLTGYACGNATLENSGPPIAPLRMTVTHDGGRTWHELTVSPATGNRCRLYINPTDTKDVVMLADQPANVVAWRSRDGGQTWQQLTLPPGDPSGVIIGQPIWAGTTLFVDAYLLLIQPINMPHILASSTNGAPLVWTDSNQLFHSKTLRTVQSVYSYAVGGTYYAQLMGFTCTNPQCTQFDTTVFVLKTSDGGATWARFMFKKDAPDIVFGTLADGHTLIGQGSKLDNSDAPFLSHDLGQTWQELPAMPQSQQMSPFLEIGVDTSAPDGTLFAWEARDERDSQGNLLHTIGPYTLLKLAPGGTAWATVVDLPGFHMFAVSSDADGHPVAVWSGTDDGDRIVPGINYHAP